MDALTRPIYRPGIAKRAVCPLWVINGQGKQSTRCPFYPNNEHSILLANLRLSAVRAANVRFWGVERTTFGGKLRLCLRRSDLLKISRPVWSEKTRRGKQRGKQFDEVARKP